MRHLPCTSSGTTQTLISVCGPRFRHSSRPTIYRFEEGFYTVNGDGHVEGPTIDLMSE
jgi:hypothetical protein